VTSTALVLAIIGTGSLIGLVRIDQVGERGKGDSEVSERGVGCLQLRKRSALIHCRSFVAALLLAEATFLFSHGAPSCASCAGSTVGDVDEHGPLVDDCAPQGRTSSREGH
jgi:hypothetical protein